jgi:hypothetical protein
VCFFKEVLCEAEGGWVVFVEGTFVLFVALGESLSSLSHRPCYIQGK